MIGSNRIGGLNSGQWQDPRSRGRFRITGGAGLGMPNGLETTRIYPGLRVPISDLPVFRGVSEPRGRQSAVSASPGRWHDPAEQLTIPTLVPRIQAFGNRSPEGLVNPVYQKASGVAATRSPRSTALMDLVTGRTDSVSLRDPALRGGAFNNWDPDSPAVAAVLDPAAAGFPDAITAGAAYGIPSAAVKRLVEAQGPRRALLAPGSVTRTLTADDVPGGPEAATLQDILDDTPRTDLTWQPGVGLTAGMGPRGDSAIERFPIDWGTGLPSDVPLRLRGSGGAIAAEGIALGGDRLGFASQDSAGVRTSQRGTADINSFGLVPVSWRNPDGSITVREIDPTRGVFSYENDVVRPGAGSDNTAQFLRTTEDTLGTMVQEAMEEAKTPVMTRQALVQARRDGRFTPLPLDQREGSLIGYITKTGVDSPLPVYAPERNGRPVTTMIDVPDGPNRAKKVPTRLFRVGSPLNRDDEELRDLLRGELVRTVTAPDSSSPVNILKIADALEKGFTLVPAELGAAAPATAAPLSLDAVRDWTGALRGQPRLLPDGGRNPMSGSLQVVNRDGSVVQTLVPEADAGGRFTGRLLPMRSIEVGPTALLDDPVVRQRGERAGMRAGLRKSEAGLEGTTGRLGAGAFMADPDVVGLGEAGYLPLLVNSVISPEVAAQTPGLGERLELFRQHQEQRGLPAQLPGVPQPDGTVAIELDSRLFPPGSHARTILRQNVHDYTNGAVDLRFPDDRSAYVAPAPTGTSPWEAFWGGVTPASAEQRRAMYGLSGQQPVRLSYDIAQPEAGPPPIAPTVIRDLVAPVETPPAPAPAFAVGPDGQTFITGLSLPDRYTPSYLDDVGAYMAAQARALPASVPPAAAGEQLRLPVSSFGQVRTLEPEEPVLRAGRAAGPYAGASYYGLGGPETYQQPLSAAGAARGFDYGRMAEDLGAELGSPEQERAMLQMARRVQQRQLERAAAQAGG